MPVLAAEAPAVSAAELLTAAELLSGIDDEIVACRAWGHRWPSKNLRTGRRMPRGFMPRAIPGGCVEVTEVCPDCGKRRTTVTLPGGVFNRAVVRDYVNPERWKRVPRSARVSARDFQGEMFRRVNEELLAEAARNSAESGA